MSLGATPVAVWRVHGDADHKKIKHWLSPPPSAIYSPRLPIVSESKVVGGWSLCQQASNEGC